METSRPEKAGRRDPFNPNQGGLNTRKKELRHMPQCNDLSLVLKTQVTDGELGGGAVISDGVLSMVNPS